MSTASSETVDSERNGTSDATSQRLSLLDRMDTSIGDASVGIGAMLTELVRRSLRGGVANIDSQLLSFANEQVQAALEQQLPLVRDVATEIADATSREITQIAVARLTDDVAARTQQVTAALEQTDHRLTSALTEVDQKFAGSLQAAGEQLTSALTDVDQRLTQSLTQTDQRFTQALDDTKTQLAGAISQTESQVRETAQAIHSTVEKLQEETRQTATQLTEKIVVTKQETDAHLQTFETDLRDAAKRSWQKVSVQLDELRSQTATIGPLLERLALAEAAQQQAEQRLAQLQADYTQSLRAMQSQSEAALHEFREAAAQECRLLAGRLEELERPRGIRAWLAKWRGKKKDAATTEFPTLTDESDPIEQA